MAALFVAPAQSQKSGRAEILFESARQKETLEGDLKGAIEQYRKIARTSDRALAAKALLRWAAVEREAGEVRKLDSTGFCLGMFADVAFEARQHILDPGDLLCLYTDGITDALEPGEAAVRALTEKKLVIGEALIGLANLLEAGVALDLARRARAIDRGGGTSAPD